MAWGLPPKFKLKKSFRREVNTLQSIVVNALDECGFTIDQNTLHLISINKKMKMSFMSIFTFSRAYIEGVVLITESGDVTIKTSYDYRSRTSSVANDLGRQKKEITALFMAIEAKNNLNQF